MAQERRVVCVVFAQALGLTELPEAERAAATDALFLRFRGVVERHGGTVDKFIGDVAMSVFGAPVSRGNDEARAMRAALEMRGEARAFSEERGLALDCRAGANTGEVLWGGIGGDRATATGDVVNVARRVMEAAAPGEILATAAVEERTRRDIAWSGTEQLKLRGREQPVDVFTASRPAEPGTVSAPPQGPMVGRAAELAALLASPSAFFVVEGSAGSGKSRLLAEYRRAVRERDPRAFVATGRAVEGAPAPLGPFADVLRSAAGTSDPAALAGWLASELGDVPGAPDARFAADALLASTGVAPAGSRAAELSADRVEAEARAAWARWLRARAQAAPVALCLEDLQEADEGTPGLMAHLARELAGERVAIVGATRPGPAEVAGYRRLVLGDLGQAETVAIAAAALGRRPGPRLTAFLREQAGGHPFYVAELARWLDASGHTPGDPAELAGAPARLPDGLHGLLVARLDAEPEEEKEALKGASVVGRAFWVPVVTETLGRDVARPIEEARARGLVTAGGPAPLAGDPELAFAHALLRDAAYALLPRRERARLHAAAAAALDAREAAAGRRAVELAARHHEAAGHPGTAARRWLRAADLAFREQSMAESLACAREAARAGGGPEAHAQAASCLMALSRFPEALEETVLAAVPEAPPEVRTRALMTRASTLERTARYAEAADAATQAYEAAPTGVLRAEAVWNQGNAFFRLDRLQEAQEAYDRA
ncbi:MAG: AAA family ATPase [Planctomycetia bacterium]|nr:AAA family ATPase [Planctomycetia bacterium]